MRNFVPNMVMISPCAGCDTSVLAKVLAFLETGSGIFTILKAIWWYFIFRVSKSKSPRSITITNTTDKSNNDNPINPTNTNNPVDSGVGPSSCSTTNNDEDVHDHDDEPDPDPEMGSDTDSVLSAVTEANSNNVLWTITDLATGTLKIALGLFLLLGLVKVDYTLIIGWCFLFPLLYFLDCIAFTVLLKHCTSKERFDRCRPYFVSSTIFSFCFNAYVLWTGISIIYWCNCRKDPFQCTFQKDYCFTFINSTGGGDHHHHRTSYDDLQGPGGGDDSSDFDSEFYTDDHHDTTNLSSKLYWYHRTLNLNY